MPNQRSNDTVLEPLTTLETAALLEIILDGISTIIETPERRFEEAGVQGAVLDVLAELQDLRIETRELFARRFFTV